MPQFIQDSAQEHCCGQPLADAAGRSVLLELHRFTLPPLIPRFCSMMIGECRSSAETSLPPASGAATHPARVPSAHMPQQASPSSLPAQVCGLAEPRHGRLPAAATETAAGTSAFQELAAGTERKYIMVSGKGGVGKTSLAASLAVRFAAKGHTTLVVSTDPAHSLGDSLAQVCVVVGASHPLTHCS
jgi:hypothetical protein